jgi:outer membrane protease
MSESVVIQVGIYVYKCVAVVIEHSYCQQQQKKGAVV